MSSVSFHFCLNKILLRSKYHPPSFGNITIYPFIALLWSLNYPFHVFFGLYFRAQSKQVDPAPSTTPSPVATSSREASPRTRRIGKTFLRDVLPRFSISLEEDSAATTSSMDSQDSKGGQGSSPKENSKEGLQAERRSRPVVKSASSSGLSLVIPPGTSIGILFVVSIPHKSPRLGHWVWKLLTSIIRPSLKTQWDHLSFH